MSLSLLVSAKLKRDHQLRYSKKLDQLTCSVTALLANGSKRDEHRQRY